MSLKSSIKTGDLEEELYHFEAFYEVHRDMLKGGKLFAHPENWRSLEKALERLHKAIQHAA